MTEASEIWCWLYRDGDDAQSIFNVAIPATETVNTLKDGIKKELSVTLLNVNVTDIDIYAIPFLDDEHLKDVLSQWKLSEHRRLDPQSKLCDLAPEFKIKRWLIVIDAPLGARL